MTGICLGAFEKRRDLPRVEEWLHRPHVAEWWGDPAEALEIIRAHPAATATMINGENRPIGFICWQQPSYDELVAAGLGDLPDTIVDIDIMIGEPNALGQGAGSAALRLLVDRLKDDGVRLIGIGTSVANCRALKCYGNAGFSVFRDFEEDGRQMRYLVRDMSGGDGAR